MGRLIGWNGNSRDFGQGDAGRGKSVSDAALEVGVFAVKGWTELGGAAQVLPGSENAEAAGEARHAGGVGPVGLLGGVADDAEDVCFGQVVDW